MKKTNYQNGFTIVELMIASTIFSVMLLIATAAILQIGRTYYKGTQQRRVQEVARDVLDQISRDIQYSGGEILESGEAKDDDTGNPEKNVQESTYTGLGYSSINFDDGIYTFCVGQKRYFYILNRALTNDALVPSDGAGVYNFKWNQALIVYNDPGSATLPGCPTYYVTDLTSSKLPGHTLKELLSPGMILAKLNVEEAGSGSGLWKIEIKIISTSSKDFIDDSGPVWRCNPDRDSSQFCAESELSTVVQKRI